MTGTCRSSCLKVEQMLPLEDTPLFPQLMSVRIFYIVSCCSKEADEYWLMD
jgi:hypothetical protein